MSSPVNFIAVSGQGANHLELVPLGNTPANVVASVENANYPATNQINRYAIEPWRPWVATLDDDVEIVFDKNQTINPGAETGDTEGWECTNTVTIVSSPVYSGTKAFQHDASESPTEQAQQVIVRAGEKITLSAAFRVGTGTARLKAYIEELGVWLQSNGTWGTETDWATTSGTSYTVATLSPTIPAYEVTVPAGVYTLNLIAYASAGTSYFDDYVCWHWTDAAALIGHNVHPVIAAVELRCSTDNFASNDTLVSTFSPLKWPTCYETFTQRGERWWKFFYNGTNDQPVWSGQFLLFQRLTLSRNPNYGILVETVMSQERPQTEAGVTYVVVREDIARRVFTFPWRYHSSAQWQEARDRIFQTSVFGKWPTIMIHDHTDTESCAFVRPPERFDFTHRFVNVRVASDFPLVELAFPTFD